MSLPLHYLTEPGAADGPLLVLLHGRGSDERDLVPLGRLLSPTATIVAPRAPFPGAPWGYGPGWAWYRFISGTTPEPDSFETGQERLATFLRDLPASMGRTGAPLIVGGFSQGGTSALAWALRHPGQAAGVVVFSGFIADHPSVRVTPDTASQQPIWWGHGTADAAIPFVHAEAGWAQLTAMGAPLEQHRFEGMGHSISREAVDRAAAFVRKHSDRDLP
jgi:phospholipase/carboxylesterase